MRLTAASADPGHLERLAALVNGRVEKMQGSTRHPSPATLLALVALDLSDEMLAESARHQKAHEASEEKLRALHAECVRKMREAQAECERKVAECEERARRMVAESESRAREVESAARQMAMDAMAEIDRALAFDDELALREQKAHETSETA